MNIIILIMEVLYYSLFMKFTKRETNNYKNILFGIILVLFAFVGNCNIYGTILMPIFGLFILNILFKNNTSLYDFMNILFMTIMKIIIEFPCYTILFSFIGLYGQAIVSSFIKILITILFRKKIKNIYIKYNIIWRQNNFYIRYIFTVGFYLYVILSLLFIFAYFM